MGVDAAAFAFAHAFVRERFSVLLSVDPIFWAATALAWALNGTYNHGMHCGVMTSILFVLRNNAFLQQVNANFETVLTSSRPKSSAVMPLTRAGSKIRGKKRSRSKRKLKDW